MALVYNITIALDAKSEERWKSWMLEVHIPDMLRTGCFRSYRFTQLVGIHDPSIAPDDKYTFAVSYIANTMADLQYYLDHYADDMRNTHAELFPEINTSFRTFLRILDEGSHSAV